MIRSQSSFRISTARLAALVAVFFLAVVAIAVHQSATASHKISPSLTARSRVMENYGRMALSFEPNRGQADAKVDFLSRGHGFEALLDKRGATLLVAAPGSTALPIRMNLVNASTATHPEAQEHLSGVVNYYRGNNPAKWHRGVPTYQRVEYGAVYPGIDLAYHGEGGKFEFDFNLKPGADAGRIALRFNGVDGAEVAADGSALLKIAQGNLTLKRPVAYQEIDGARHEVSADYKIAAPSHDAKSSRITVVLGDYDHSRPLTIDPVLLFSTYFGGTVTQIQGATIDGSGNVYITGWAFNECSPCTQFPSTGGPTYAGAGDAFISKLSSDGSTIIYATLIGGSAFDEASSVAVDGANNAYITGQTFSADFPATVGTTTAPGGAGDGFVAKFNSSGAVTWATYIAGSDADDSNSIALKQGCTSNCNPYVTGRTRSSNFTGASGFVGAQDAFVTELTADGSGTVYSTLLGGSAGQNGAGSGVAFANGIAVDSVGDAFVAGGTDSSGFPATSGSITGSTDAFAAKLNSSGNISYARLFGGSDYDFAIGVALQPGCAAPCNAYLHGVTFSKDFPVTAGVLQNSLNSEAAEFVTELPGNGTSPPVFSTYLGASDFRTFSSGNGIAVDTSGDVFLTGSTASQNFPPKSQIENAPPSHGELLSFGPSGSATPTSPTWPASNGTPLIIQESSGTDIAVFVGSTTGLFTSTDGMTFSQAPASGLPAGAVTALQVDGIVSPNGVIFAGSPTGLYISSDLGDTFSASALVNKNITLVTDINNSNTPVPESSLMVLAGTVGNGAWFSTNGGATFSQVTTGIPTTATVTALTANDSSNAANVTAFIGTSRGVYVSTDVLSSFPGHWTVTNLTSPAIASMNADRNSTPPVDYAGTNFEGIFESTDNFNTFISPTFPLVGVTAGALDRDNSTTPSTIYAGLVSLQQAYVFENTAGYNGTFVATSLANQAGAIHGLKNPLAGEVLDFHPVVTELNPTGTQLIFSTYLASSSWDTPGGIAIDPTGTNIYVAGTTYGANFPIAGPTPAGTAYDGFSNGFVSKIGPPAGATGTATPTPTATSTSAATPTATATATSTSTATPSVAPTPNGAKISAPSKVAVKPVGIGIGASSTAKVVIKNIGKNGSLIGNISLTNTPPGNAFKISAAGPFDIAPHGTLPETITFTPDATSDGATLTITSNDPTKGVINLNLTGTGLPGKLSVPKSLTIKSTGVGVPGTANLVLKNVGKGVLTGMSMAAQPDPPFSGGGEGGGGGIAPHATSTVTITFTPQNSSPATGSIQLVATPPNTGSATVTLKGIVKAKK